MRCSKGVYAFPNFYDYIGKRADNKIIKDTFDISDYILEAAKVVTVPGDGFGAPGYIRLSYAINKKHISEGIKRIKVALEILNRDNYEEGIPRKL